ncbi:MAG: biotin carboxylase N-terminal domain-containing protein [Candidatus Thalassarchaeaceae archaeon]|jgi:acetyl/propionyl-CoA carboxylase alpha subunit|nr:biotin carboxylase N-terminal domain-containing protein [Candidatus Thalassarchaeaceae archaeon]
MSQPAWIAEAPFKFSKVLIANRGEIACRIIRGCKEMGLATVAIFNDSDIGAMHVELADESVHLEGSEISSTYLSHTAIINACRTSGADALHPGYGFLSERSDFAELVGASGIIWIGPPAKAIDSMGDKVRSRRLMIDAEIPLVPGAELVPGKSLSETVEELHRHATEIGYPLLLKASAGGGGKGMREVNSPGELETSYLAAQREALSSFGDDTVYIERRIVAPRHIEIQLLCDTHGGAIHLLERECSIQRRHQKVIEEAPSSALSAEIRQAMGEAAVNAARAVHYVGAGTVEFLQSGDDFFFLEMNTRLQVEHPVTEFVTGVDLVQEQLRIAAGLPLTISQEQVSPRGWAIEARIYSEDAANGFLPATGPLRVWRPPEGPGIRLDTGVREGDEARIDFDPMLAKLIVHAPSREGAIERMRRALGDFVILGVTTNIEFLHDVITHPQFASGATTTDFIEREWPNGWSSCGDEKVAVIAAAIGEKAGLHLSSSPVSQSDSIDPYNPFMTIGRSFP